MVISEGKARKAALQAMGFKSYNEYLKSYHWWATRRIFIHSEYVTRINGRPVCSSCKRLDQKLHVHHKTYVNLGREEHSDLLLLCENCHAEEHVQKKKVKKEPLLKKRKQQPKIEPKIVQQISKPIVIPKQLTLPPKKNRKPKVWQLPRTFTVEKRAITTPKRPKIIRLSKFWTRKTGKR